MKRFVILNILFALLLFGILFALRCVMVFSISHRMDAMRHNEDVHTLVLGSSQAMNLWNDTVIPHSENRSEIGLALFSNYNELSLYDASQYVTIDTVVVVLSLHSLLSMSDKRFEIGKDGVSSLEREEWRSTNNYMSFLKYWFWREPYLQSLFFFWHHAPIVNPHSDGHYEAAQYCRFDSLRWNEYQLRINHYLTDTSIVQSMRHLSNSCSYMFWGLDILNDYCLQANKTLEILIPPQYEASLPLVDQAFQLLMRQHLGDSALVADYRDYFSHSGNEYFADWVHVNQQGAEVFSRHVAQDGLQLQYMVDYCNTKQSTEY